MRGKIVKMKLRGLLSDSDLEVDLVALGLPRSDHHPMPDDPALGHDYDAVANVVILVVHLIGLAGR